MLLTLHRSALAVAATTLLVALATPAAGASPGTDVVGGPALGSSGVVADLGPTARPLPKVIAESWVLADLTTGEVLAAKAAHRLGRPASTLKTLTAVTLLPKLDRDSVHTATYDEARADGGHVGLVPDAPYSIWDLWHGLLLPSGNDAAAALANANGGMAATVADMQAVAVRLQARDTTVRNSSGLDAKRQFTSAYDMALFAQAAMADADFRSLTSTISYDFPGRKAKAGQERKTYKIYTQNRLLLRGYKGTVGGKTGFTSLAHRTFWAAATRGGHTLVVTLLQIGQPTETAAESLLSWGFANRARVTPVGTLVDPLVEGSTEPAAETPGQGTGTGTSAAGSTTTTTAVSSGSGVPAWGWALGLLLVAGGLGAILLGRRSRSVPSPSPAVAPAVASTSPSGATVVPGRHAGGAAQTSPSVVVSIPGRPVGPTPPENPGPGPRADESVPAPDLEATGPVPLVVEPTAVVDAVREETDDAAAPRGETAEPAQAPASSPGGNVRVIRPGSST